MKKNSYTPLNRKAARGAPGARLAINRRRSLKCLEEHMTGVEDRLDELTNFQGWALARMEEQAKLNEMLKEQVEEMFIFKDAVIHKLNNELHAPTHETETTKKELEGCSSPTTPAPLPVNRYIARRVSIPCGGLLPSSSSEECVSPDAITERLDNTAGTRGNDLRQQREEARFKLTFSPTQTQAPPDLGTQEEN